MTKIALALFTNYPKNYKNAMNTLTIFGNNVPQFVNELFHNTSTVAYAHYKITVIFLNKFCVN